MKDDHQDLISQPALSSSSISGTRETAAGPQCTLCGKYHMTFHACDAFSFSTFSLPPASEVSDNTPVKASYVGAPAIFLLERECQSLNDAFGGFGCFLVGSSLYRPDWRDVDVRLVLSDAEFATLFPDAGLNWECDPRWLIMTTSISAHLSRVTGLPVDFQFQQFTHTNKRHKGMRSALGMRTPSPRTKDE